MSWPLLGIISIIGLIFLRVFHKQIITNSFVVTAIYTNNHFYNLRSDKKIVQALLTKNKDASHLPELMTALHILTGEPTVFQSEQVFAASENLLNSLASKRYSSPAKPASILSYSQERGYGGVEIHSNEGSSTTYLIGRINSILKMTKNVQDKEEILRLDNKYEKQSSTNIAIAVHENDSINKNVLYDGFNKKIDLIGCLFITAGT